MWFQCFFVWQILWFSLYSYSSFFFCFLSLLFATFVCHWAAHIAVAVVINGPTKAEDVSWWWWWWRWYCLLGLADLPGLPFKWNLCSQARPQPALHWLWLHLPTPTSTRTPTATASLTLCHQSPLSSSWPNEACCKASRQRRGGSGATLVNAAKLRRRSTKP